ncbi:MAG: hypothetical protein L0207_02545 [Chlamydiae bacterium]|nr:hypothetical protein [Chlamydiota bacterium]
MKWLIAIPFFVQAFLILFDEYYFHIKRGLPKWERIGHPIDTLSLLICLLFTCFISYSDGALKWYLGLGVISCLMVTKDEFIHKHVCPASENWVHALLFINHPILLGGIGLIWWALSLSSQEIASHWYVKWMENPSHLQYLLYGQVIAMALFLCYQIIYWNFIWKEEKLKLYR